MGGLLFSGRKHSMEKKACRRSCMAIIHRDYAHGAIVHDIQLWQMWCGIITWVCANSLAALTTSVTERAINKCTQYMLIIWRPTPHTKTANAQPKFRISFTTAVVSARKGVLTSCMHLQGIHVHIYSNAPLRGGGGGGCTGHRLDGPGSRKLTAGGEGCSGHSHNTCNPASLTTRPVAKLFSQHIVLVKVEFSWSFWKENSFRKYSGKNYIMPILQFLRFFVLFLFCWNFWKK